MVESSHKRAKIHFLLLIPLNTTSLEYKGTDQTKQAKLPLIAQTIPSSPSAILFNKTQTLLIIQHADLNSS